MPLLAACALSLLSADTRGGVTLTTLVSFSGTDRPYLGASPDGRLIFGADGKLYGTTSEGGSNNVGTVFRLTTAGTFETLFSFDGANGSGPNAGLTSGADGNFYGTTFSGGVSNWGTVFRLTPKGSFKTLYHFTGADTPESGANPSAALVRDHDGNLFGTASYGGSTNRCYDGFGYGTIFELGTNQLISVPLRFGNTNGARPSSGMILARDGCFYGTTTWGGIGAGAILPGFGTIFKIAPDGTFTTLYRFSGSDDGGFIYAGLVQGCDGDLYGAACNGGAYGYGTLFKITTNGCFTLLHTFTYFESGSPYASLIEGSDGNFYGTTYGMFAGVGSIYRVTPAGQFATLAIFNISNGANPDAPLVQGPDGNFYGTTSKGGANGLGTVFRLSVPFQPMVQLTISNSTLVLNWDAVVGQSYQVQYLCGLSQTNWQNLGDPIPATNTVMTATDPINFDSQRVYRVVLP